MYTTNKEILYLLEKQGLSELSGAGEGAQEMSVEKKKKRSHFFM